MKTYKQLLEYYTRQLQKSISAYGFDDDKTTYSFFLVQGVRMGMPETEIFNWASSKVEGLHEESLSLINIYA